jgi:DNA-binding transcriptional regulator YiaG
MTPQEIKMLATELNGGVLRGRTPRLAKLLGVSVDTVRSWTTTDTNGVVRREMSPSARRFLAMLVVLYRRGEDLDSLRSAARALQRSFTQGDDE